MNKEPPATKITVERMYRSHRERLQKSKTVIDDHVVIPEFMKTQRWREIDKERKQKLLEIDNEHFYGRLTKAENKISIYTAANIEHTHLISSMRKHMCRLKENDRLRKQTQIQRENEYMLVRLQRVRPKSTAASMTDWYQNHIRFKEGR